MPKYQLINILEYRKIYDRALICHDHATFATDDWEPHKGVIPGERDQVCAKGSGRTNIIERFNCTPRQRISRLVRGARSFSKILENHIGAIKYYLYYYDQEVMQPA